MDGMELGMGISVVTTLLGFVVPMVIVWVVLRALGLGKLRSALIGSLWGRVGFPWRLLWWLLASGFIGLMIATAGGAIYPPVVQPAAQLLCDGQVGLQSQGYSYKPGQRGVAHTITCTAAEGAAEEITFQSVFLAAALYGAALLVLRLLWWLLRRQGDASDPDRVTGLSSGAASGGQGPTGLGSTLQGLSDVLGAQVAAQVQEALQSAASGHVNVTVNGQAMPMTDDVRERLRGALHNVSDGKVATFTSTTVNGQPVGGAAPANDAATRLRQLQQLRDQGLISAAEFDAKRAAILQGL